MAASNLRVSVGEPITASHHNGLVSLAGSLQIQRGALKGRRLPEGFIPHVDVQQNTVVNHAFRLRLTTDKDGLTAARIDPGFVAGIIPRIRELHLDETDENDNPPLLTVPEKAWKTGKIVQRALIMFRYDLDHTSFAVIDVEAVAVSEVPASKPYTWHKLVGYLTRKDAQSSVKKFQMLFFNQYFETSERRANGFFHAWPRIA